MESEQTSEVQEILNQQKQLKLAREKVSRLLGFNVAIISGDMGIRELVKGYLETLGFHPERVRTSNSSADVIARVKKNPDDVDLVICHLKTLDSRVSSQTGAQALKIIQDILLNTGASKTIPFIFIEKEFNRNDILNAFRSGASQFVVLPSNPVSLGAKLSEAFDRPRETFFAQEVNKLLLEGNKLQEQGLFDQAIALYNKALVKGGENVTVLTEKANTLLKMGDVEQAISVFKRVTEVEANFPRAYQGLGSAYSQLGNLEEARKNYQKVMELEPHNVQVVCSLGEICHDEGDLESAKAYFEKGIAVNDRFIKNYLGLAKNYEAQDNPRESYRIYKTAIKHNPSQTFLYLTAGDFCLKHDLNEEAETIFGEAISQNETHIHLYNRMGIALRKQKKFDKAITNFAKAIKIRPDDANLRYNLAKAYFIKGEELTAIDKLNKSFELDPDLKPKFERDTGFSRLIEKYPAKFNL